MKNLSLLISHPDTQFIYNTVKLNPSPNDATAEQVAEKAKEMGGETLAELKKMKDGMRIFAISMETPVRLRRKEGNTLAHNHDEDLYLDSLTEVELLGGKLVDDEGTEWLEVTDGVNEGYVSHDYLMATNFPAFEKLDNLSDGKVNVRHNGIIFQIPGGRPERLFATQLIGDIVVAEENDQTSIRRRTAEDQPMKDSEMNTKGFELARVDQKYALKTPDGELAFTSILTEGEEVRTEHKFDQVFRNEAGDTWLLMNMEGNYEFIHAKYDSTSHFMEFNTGSLLGGQGKFLDQFEGIAPNKDS